MQLVREMTVLILNVNENDPESLRKNANLFHVLIPKNSGSDFLE